MGKSFSRRFWVLGCLIVAIFFFATPDTSLAQGAKDCGGVPCPGTSPAIWPDRSAAVNYTIQIFGWNLTPQGDYDIVVVAPDASASWAPVTADVAGELLSAPYTHVVGSTLGTYEVRLYASPWGGDLNQAPVAATTFFHNNFSN